MREATSFNMKALVVGLIFFIIIVPTPFHNVSASQMGFQSNPCSTSSSSPPSETFDDWPMFCRDSCHTSFTSSHIVPPLKLVSRLRLPEGCMFCCGDPTRIVIVDDVVFTDTIYDSTKNEERFYALDLKNGTIMWDVERYVDGGSAPAVMDGIVYYQSGPEIYALNATNGEEIWSYRTEIWSNARTEYWDSHSNLVCAKGVVYAVAWDSNSGRLYALNGTTGAQIWSFLLLGVSSSPSVGEGMVYVISKWGDTTRLYAFNASTGELVWYSDLGDSYDDLGDSYVILPSMSPPIVASQKVFAGNGIFDAKTGDICGNLRVGFRSAIAEDVLYTTNDEFSALCAYNITTGKPIWIWKYEDSELIPSGIAPRTLMVADKILYADIGDFLLAFNVITGKPLWYYFHNTTRDFVISGTRLYMFDGNMIYVFEESVNWCRTMEPGDSVHINIIPKGVWSEIQVFWSNAPITIMTNSSVLAVQSEGNRLIMEVAGVNGTIGMLNVTVPKDFVPMSSNITIYLDSEPLNLNFTQYSSYSIASIRYHHSKREIAIRFPSYAQIEPTLTNIRFLRDSQKRFIRFLPSFLPYIWLIAITIISMLVLIIILYKKNIFRL